MSSDHVLADALAKFKLEFKSDPEFKCFAPGRVNLIGEHVDYNDGFVLPFALGFKTVVVGSLITTGSTVSKVITTIPGLPEVEFDVTKDMKKEAPEWANYVKGTVAQYITFLPKGFSFNAVICSNVPLGSGLSSSASLEVATATLIEAMLTKLGISFEPNDGVAKALRCQKAEHEWADTPCGIMDQYISAMGCDKHLLLIDCRSNEATLVPFGGDNDSDSDFKSNELPILLIANSNVKHSLSGSEYPDRVKQCRTCVTKIKENIEIAKAKKITALRDVTMDMLLSAKDSMDDLSYRRGLHCIEEDARTLACVEALKKGDFVTVGKHMTSSHNSLRDNFEVSCPELDVLVELALQVPGVLGSRMTGGGFGGCTITMVEANQVNALKSHLKTEYPKRCIGHECSLYESLPSAGSGMM
jgi:galactokinase